MAKKHHGKKANVFALAAKNKAFKSAKRAAERAEKKSSHAWKKALRMAMQKNRRRK